MTMNVNGKDCINLATFNFLGFVGKETIEVSSIVSLSLFKNLCIF